MAITEPGRPASAGAADTGAWTSFMLRLAIAALFIAAVVPKWRNGLGGLASTADYFVKTFEQAWLPLGLVRIMGYITPFVEALIVLWLLTGIRLKIAWIFSTAFLICLAFGMLVAGKNDVGADNFLYVAIASLGLYISRYDRFNLDPWGHR